ncbi:MAG: polysaccharide deacetylase family protein, partial [Candidatus Zixiibacteriota bacterium]
ICLTFDNLPADRNYAEDERNRINEEILSALKKNNVKAAGFIVGSNIEGDWKLVIDWLEDGHTIGFLTYSGQDVDNVPIDMFIADIAKGKQTLNDILNSYNQKGRYFRFPYLHYGSEPVKRNRIEGLLKEQKITIAHASIVVEDFVYNLSLEKIINYHDSTKILQLRDEYLEHITEQLASAETLAMEIVNRPVRQILQLRANKLNAVFLDDIIQLFAEKGYSFISLDTALKDKVYQIFDNYYENKSLSYLERLKASE